MISSMLRTINKRDQNNSRKRATIANVYASTPKNAVANFGSISLSEIDTASSSSGGRRNLQLQLQMQELANKDQRRAKRKKREDTKWRMKDTSFTDSEWNAKQKQLINESLKEKRKKNLKRESKKKVVKRKRISKSTDSEWETESEKSIDELSTSLQNSILNDDECIKLFEDPCTPEKTRDMPSAYKEILPTYESPIIDASRKRSHLISNLYTPEKTRDIPSAYEETLYTHESPIICSSGKRPHLISKKNDTIPQDTLLPINLLLTEVRNLEETDEDEAIFHYESNMKTHIPLRKPEKSLKEKPENFNFPAQFPTTNSLHRDRFVKTYPGMTSRHLASFAQTPKLDFMQKYPNIPKRRESSPKIPPGMTCVSGYWDKTLQKWKMHRENSSQNEFKNGKRKTKASKKNTKKFVRKQKYDVYVDEVDSEFETGGQNGKRMSFREFCHKQKKRG